MAAEIERLIERLQKATGPDREADVRVWSWLTKRNLEEKLIRWLLSEGEIEEDYGRAAKKGLNCDIMVEVPHFTSSIDAALTLVTNGLAWACAPHWDEREHRLYKPYDGRDPKHRQHWPEWQGIHKHDAIALCIAALKARAALEKDSENEG